MPRFGFRGFPRPEEEDPLFSGQDTEMIPPWEREALPEIRSIPPEIAESPDPQPQGNPFLVDRLVKDFSAQLDEPNAEVSTPVFEKYLEEIQNAPRREDYEVGTGRKILAGIAGAATGFTSGASAGAKTIQDITESPYRNAQRDFKERIEPLEKGVGFEKHFAETARKATNDHRNYGFKVADIQAKKNKAMGDLQVAFERAENEDDKNAINAARVSIEAEFKRQMADINRGNMGANQTRANAAMIRANKPPGTGSAPKGHFVSPTQQTHAVKLAKQKTFEETQRVHPNIAVTQDPKTMELVFGKDVTPEDEEKFYENYNLNKSIVEQGILNKRQQ